MADANLLSLSLIRRDLLKRDSLFSTITPSNLNRFEILFLCVTVSKVATLGYNTI